MLELGTDARRDPAVTLARAGLGERAQVADGGLAGRQRVVGEAIAEVGERERTLLGDAARRGQRGTAVGEQRRHGARRLEMMLGVGEQATAGAVERGLLAQTGEHVEQRPAARRGVADVVADGERNGEALGDGPERAVEALRGGIEMALQVDDEAIGEQALQARDGGLDAAAAQRRRERTVGAAGEAEEAVGVAVEVRPVGH